MAPLSPQLGVCLLSLPLSLSLCAMWQPQEELLTGDNQYFCSHCGCNRDATRRIQLMSTPPILTLLLLRFVFNM